MANERAIPPSLLSFDSKLAARKAVFRLFFKATKCVISQAIHIFPLRIPFERVFWLVLADD